MIRKLIASSLMVLALPLQVFANPVTTSVQDFSVYFGQDEQAFLNMGGDRYEWRSASTGECITLKGRPKLDKVKLYYGLQYSKCDSSDPYLPIWNVEVLNDFQNFQIRLNNTDFCVSIHYDMVYCGDHETARIALPIPFTP